MLSQDQIQAIQAPFPSEALSSDTSRGFELTSIKAAFVIERLKLPVQYLSLYPGDGGILWTQNVAIDRADDEFSRMTLGRKPQAAGKREAVAGPRIAASGNILVRAFASLFKDSRKKDDGDD